MQPASLKLVHNADPVDLAASAPDTILPSDLATKIALSRRRLTQALSQLIKAEDLARAGDDCGAQGRILVALARLESEQERLSTLAPSACECGGHGPHARRDGHRYDSAGIDCPCPDCGATARQAMRRGGV